MPAVRLGPLYMMGATLAFTLMVTLVKVARQELSAMEIIVWRGLVAVPIAGALALRVGLRPRNTRVVALRAVLGFTAMSLYFTAAKGLPVADLSIITRIQPLLVAALAPLVLGADERVGWHVWVILAVGLGGCAAILAPDMSAGGVDGLVAAGATLLAAGAHLTLRLLARTDDPRVVVFWFQVVMLLFAGVGVTFETGRPLTVPTAGLVPVVIAAGIAAIVGQVLLTVAYREDRAAVVAAAGYTGPAWAVIADLAIWGVVPTAHVIIGGLVVIGAGLVLVLKTDRAAAIEPS